METLQVISSFLTPLILLIFGIMLNRRLEQNKIEMEKKKDWQSWWAGKFLEVAHEYNSAVSRFVTGLSKVAQLQNEQHPGWEDSANAELARLNEIIHRLQYLDWEIQNYTQFARKTGPEVTGTQRTLFNLLSSLAANLKGDLEEIRAAQFKFNQALRQAHEEILK